MAVLVRKSWEVSEKTWRTKILKNARILAEPQLPEISYTQQKPRTDNCNKCSKINAFTTFYTCNSDEKEIQYKSKVTLKINELRGTKQCISIAS